MLRFDDSPKRATNLSLNAKVLEMARELGMNISQTVDGLLAEEVKRRYWEQWNERNKGAIEAYNQRVRSEGIWGAKYRTVGRGLGDARGDDADAHLGDELDRDARLRRPMRSGPSWWNAPTSARNTRSPRRSCARCTRKRRRCRSIPRIAPTLQQF